MNFDPNGNLFFSFLVASIIIGSVFGGTTAYISAKNSGESGWDLAFDTLGGIITGGAFGAAMALGGAAGLAATGATVAGFGLSTTAALAISVGVTATAGLASYSLNCAASDTQNWNFGQFITSGIQSGIQGAATFGLAYLGGKSGLFNKLGNFRTPSDFYISFANMNSITSTFYASQVLVGESISRMIFVSGTAAFSRWVIDKAIYGV